MLCAPNENLHLPAPNVFICTDLSLKSAQEKVWWVISPRDRYFLLIFLICWPLKQVKFPVLLRKSSYSRLWYKPDSMFSTPKAYVKIDFNCPHAGNSPEAEVLTDIFTRLLMDYLNEYGKKMKFINITWTKREFWFLFVCLMFNFLFYFFYKWFLFERGQCDLIITRWPVK